MTTATHTTMHHGLPTLRTAMKVQAPLDNLQSSTGILVPKEDTLALMNCEVAEGIWMGQTELKIPVTNWGSLPLVLQQGDVIAHIEEAAIVT